MNIKADLYPFSMVFSIVDDELHERFAKIGFVMVATHSRAKFTFPTI